MIGPLIALAFILVPIIEVYLIVQASNAIGFLNTLVVLFGFSILGAWLVRREGVRVWERFNRTIAAGQVPSKEIAQGVCLLVAGALLITPGFFTDAIGVLLLLPPFQALLVRLLVRRIPGGTRVMHATYRSGVYDARSRDDAGSAERAGPGPDDRPPQDGPRGELEP